jgi:hypothetical protein
MNTISRRHYALNVCAAAAMLAGCGGSQLSTGVLGAVPNSDKLTVSDKYPATRNVVPNHVFDARYSGRYECDVYGTSRDQKFYYLFMGHGTASVPDLRKSRESVYYYFGSIPCGISPTGGSFTLKDRSSEDTITGSVSGNDCSVDTYTVTGGTGRYSGAIGSGTVTFTCTGNHYEDTWSGTISY